MEKRIDTIISVFTVMLVVFVMLASPAIASGEPSIEASREPSTEMASPEPGADMPSFSSAEVLANVLMDAAGIEATESTAEIVAGMNAAEVAKELRSLLDMTQLMTDEQLKAQITSIASAYGYSFTDAELDSIVTILRSFEPLTIDELQTRIEQMREGYMAVEEIRDGLSSLGDRVQAFIQKIIELFRLIFGNGERITLPV